MGSTFGTYSVAYSGMYVNQAMLATTSANLSNVETAGASRVRAASIDINTGLSSGTSTGSGVSVASITRARDALLDSTYRTQNANAAYGSVKSGNLEYIDEILCEYDTIGTTDDAATATTTTTSGVQQGINDFFNAWQTLSTDSSSESCRTAVRDAGVELVEMLNDIDAQLQQLQEDAVNGVKDGVDSLNELAEQVADLNQQITKAEVGGSEASYLRDQRDVLLDEMSALGDIRVTESGGILQVTLGGSTLVNGTKTHTLIVEGSGTTADPLVLKWADSDSKVTINSGSIKGYLEEADQTGYETIDESDIPYDFTTSAASSISTMRQALNVLITTLAIEINSLSSSGVDLNGDTGLAFFTAIDSSKPLSSANIEVNPQLAADTKGDKIVASSSDEDGDNTIANEIWDLFTDNTFFKNSDSSLTVTQFYEAVTKWIGIAGDEAASTYETQAALVTQVDNQRQAISGISIDEEMSNMIQFQNAYAASARVMSTIDSLIAGLIEDLG